MRVASVTDVKNRLSEYLARARRKEEPILITRHGKPYALIQPIAERDLDSLEWKGVSETRLGKAWEEEDHSLYDYLYAKRPAGRERGPTGGRRSWSARRSRPLDRSGNPIDQLPDVFGLLD
jgi:prevent-host-death family protein